MCLRHPCIQMDEKISSEFFGLLFNLCIKSTTSPYSLGESIGNRLADDFILHTGISRKLSIDEFVHTVQNDFFPHYFSYSPKRRGNVLLFKHFNVFAHMRDAKGALNVFAGILNVIGACLCDDISVKAEDGNVNERGIVFNDRKNEKMKFYNVEMQNDDTST
ncbi:putative Heme NO binding protein [Trachipleistophora hominis]|uniref:Putative Heme NO binding protein n=1 Tax=Trachipleistophora hominis TaxID=72359 RepID=L7JWE4_TRAHO|nr:putative Heme NO binding protein [Trachipleistophora hominis]